MKRLILSILIFSLPTFAAAGSSIPDEQKRIIDTSTWKSTLTQGELFDDLDTWSMSPSQMQISYDDYVKLGMRDGVLCASVEDPYCGDGLGRHVRALLPVCADPTTERNSQYCIEDFYAVKDGKKIEGIFQRRYPDIQAKGQFKAEPEYDLPAGSAASLWQLPGVTHAGASDLYWVNAQLLGDFLRQSTNVKYGKFRAQQLWSSISGVTEISFPGAKPMQAYSGGGGDSEPRPLSPSGAQCLIANTDACIISWALSEEITYGMKIRMAHPITGWMHGRINNPNISTSTDKNGLFYINLEGAAVKVPTLYASTPWDQASAAIKKRFGSKPSGCCGETDKSWYESAGRNQSSQEMVSDLNVWLPYVKDTASATPTYWIVRTTTNAETANSSCLIKGAVNGVVTTNATAYTSGAPVFNKKFQSLDYKVASPHFSPEGGVNIGNYNLQINSKVARCLYGFNSAPVSATVSIISSNGEKQVATTTLKESGGWIYLKAAGFSYSAPTVRVVLSQKKTATKKK